jgi:hypothetical protein
VFQLLSPNEPALSRVIADLLDARGSHGQGHLFLNSLLEKAGLPTVRIRDFVRVEREVRTVRTKKENRRIDIVVETPTVVLGIENKPWAVQQPNQLADYLEDVQVRGNREGKGSALLFLSDQKAETASDQIKQMSYQAHTEKGYPSLYNVLSTVVGSIKAERARAFIHDFRDFIDVQFGEGRMSNKRDEPYVQAVQAEYERGAARKKALATVLLSQQMLHHRILGDIGDFLFSQVQRVGNDFESGRLNTTSWAFEPGNVPLRLEEKSKAWGVRRRSWPPNCTITIYSSSDYQKGIYYGVYAPDPTSNEVQSYPESMCIARPRLERLYQDVAGSLKPTVWWPWYQYAEPRNWGPEFAARIVLESPDGDIKSNQYLQELAGTLSRLAEAVDHALIS